MQQNIYSYTKSPSLHSHILTVSFNQRNISFLLCSFFNKLGSWINHGKGLCDLGIRQMLQIHSTKNGRCFPFPQVTQELGLVVNEGSQS